MGTEDKDKDVGKDKKIHLGESFLGGSKKASSVLGDQGFRIKNILFPDMDSRKEFGKDSILDFDEALKRADSDIDPEKILAASDDIEPGRQKARFGQRDLWANVEKYKKVAEEYGETEEYREKQIQDKKDKIQKEMDRRDSDILQISNSRGYFLELVRIPIPEKSNPDDLEITIGGKKVSVHKDLEGMSVSTSGSRPEISIDMIKKAADDMAKFGMLDWNKNLDSADSVDISVEASFGKTPVVLSVSDELHGDETVFKPAGKYISGELWNEALEDMKRNKTGQWMKSMPGSGSVVSCGISAKVNGKEAAIEGITDREGEAAGIDKATWEKACEEMMRTGKQSWATTLSDGTTVSISLNTYVDQERATIDRTIPGKTVEDMPARLTIGKDMWEKGVNDIISDPSTSNRTMIRTGTGRQIELRMNMKVNGIAAVPNVPFKPDEVRETKSGITISRELAEKAIDEMNKNNNATSYKTNTMDGREVMFKRAGELKMFVNEQEISKDDFNEALAEVSGLNSSEERDGRGQQVVEMRQQKSIIMSRRIGEAPFTAAHTAANTVKNQAVQGTRMSGEVISLLKSLIMGAVRSR